jgi:hypothetical protein
VREGPGGLLRFLFGLTLLLWTTAALAEKPSEGKNTRSEDNNTVSAGTSTASESTDAASEVGSTPSKSVNTEFPPSPQPPPSTDDQSQTEFDRCMDFFNRGDYLAAADRFESFLKAYPDSPLRPKAEYYLAESDLLLASEDANATSEGAAAASGGANAISESTNTMSGANATSEGVNPTSESAGPAPESANTTSEGKDGIKDFVQKMNISGSIRGGYWSSSQTLDDRNNLATASLWLKAAPKLNPNLSILVEGWIMNEQLFRADQTQEQLREAYLDTSFGPMDFRIGKQIIVWGRTDRINPTDNLSPRDFTLLVPEDDDQRLGTPAIKAAYYFKDISISAYWLPDFQSDTIPIPPLPTGVTLTQDSPDSSFGAWAAKVEQTGKLVDWSLSYFNGYDQIPDLSIPSPTTNPFHLLLKNNRIDVIGADAATTLGRYGLRAEAAYTITQDSRGNNPYIKNPFFFLVMGADRTFIEYLNINVQYLIRVIVNYQNPEATGNPIAIEQAVISNQLDQVQQGATVRINYKWLNETLDGEIATVFLTPHFSYSVRPKVTYAFTDRWKGIIGSNLYEGNNPSFFGYLHHNSTAYAEIRWSF